MAQTWKQTLALADSLFSVNSVDSALLVASTALRQVERDLGPNDLALVPILERIGKYQEHLDDLEAAEATLNRALAIGERELGADQMDVASVLYGLAVVNLRQGRYEEAEKHFSRSLDIRRTLLPANHSAFARSKYGLACLYFAIGNYLRASELGQEALTIWQNTGDPYVCRAYLLMGNVTSAMGLFDKSELNYGKAAEISQDVNGPNHPITANALSGLANLYYWENKLAEAEQLYMQALEILLKTSGPEHTEVARMMINIGLVLQAKGMYIQAENYYTQALSIMKKSLGQNHIGYAKALESVASSYIDQGRFSEAESLLIQTLSILEKALGPQNMRVTYTLESLSEVKLRMGQPVEAANYEIRAMQIVNTEFGPDHPHLAEHLVRLGEIRAYQGSLGEAESHFSAALDILEATTNENYPLRAECLELLSDCYRKNHKAAECLESGRRAVTIRQNNLLDFVEVVPEKDALIYSQHLRNSVNNYISCCLEFGINDNSTSRAVADLLLSTKGQVSDAIFDRKKQLMKLLQTAESLRLAKFEVSQLFVGSSSKTASDNSYRTDSLSGLIDRLESDLAFSNSAYGKDLKRRTTTAERIIRLLPPEAALVEYARIDFLQAGMAASTPRYIVAIISSDEPPKIIDLGNASEIDPLINRYRQELLAVSKSDHLPTTTDLYEYKKVSRALNERVFNPIEKYLSKTRLIFVAPDGGLNLVSFAGLSDADGKYLIEKFALQYLSSGRDLIRLNEENKTSKGLFAIGDPDYDAPASERFSYSQVSENSSSRTDYDTGIRNVRSGCSDFENTTVKNLPGTRTEVEQIVKSWKVSAKEPWTVCLGLNASEERFKAEAPGNRVIHLATHGYFLEGACVPKNSNRGIGTKLENVDENPLLLSGLFFAGANLHGQGSETYGTEDGVLTAYEVSEMNLEGTNLVVLSACETGLGEVKDGEGVYGLRRAFQMAGARTVVSALWPVSDKETASIMSELYKETNETLPEKMRSIQLARISQLRKDGFADHPFAWGAFIATGDWR